MNRRDIVIGGAVLLVLAGVFYFRSQESGSEMKVPETKIEGATTEKDLEEKFKIDIADDAPKAELKSVSDGDGSGIASRKKDSGNHIVTILADLPDPESGSIYHGWLVKGEEGKEDYNLISLGRLTSAKGGYMLHYESKTDYSDHTKVVLSEEKGQSNKITKAVLEGNF